MARTFLLTWNPDKWGNEPPHGKIDSWACRTKAPNEGDRVFLSRVGREPRGICASGRVVSFSSGDTTRLGEHWDSERSDKQCRYVRVQWDSDPPFLSHRELERELEKSMLGDMQFWTPQNSGIQISKPAIAVELERCWAHARRASQSPGRDSTTSSRRTSARQRPPVGERPAAVEFSAQEGALKEQKRLTQGRNRTLRDKALQQAMGRCAACGRDYSKVLDGAGKRVLEVHHRRQLSLRETPELTRVTDLAVVCANCHRLLHVNQAKTLKVEELKRRLKKH